MQDLQMLNQKLLAFSRGGKPHPNDANYVQYMAVCSAGPRQSTGDWKELLRRGVNPVRNSPDLIRLNSEYLKFARQVSVWGMAGRTAALVMLHFDMERAIFCASLSDVEIGRLASCTDGAIFSIASDVTTWIGRIHQSAAPYHAAAMILPSRRH